MRTLELTGNKIYKQPHSITIPDKLLTLIGENGCGKSSILEALFDQYKENEATRVICFSSGQNESFTKIYEKFLRESNKFLIDSYADRPLENYINTFYFNKDWVKLLIFFASSIKFEGLTNTFLRNKGYLKDLNGGQELPLLIILPFRILKYYVSKIEVALKKEELEYNYKSIRNTIFHQLLSKIAEETKEKYDFDRPIVKTKIMLSSSTILNVLDNKNVDAIFTFLGLATKDDRFIIKDDTELYLNGVELNEISDGEFQLLSIYALLDLFDNEETLFLFDEIDSHLYFENINKLWETLKAVKGNIITTTHSGDSIIRNDIKNIKLVDKGLVNEKTLADTILNRLNNLAAGNYYKMKVASKIEYIALVENKTDWFIFEHLCRKTIPTFDEQKFNKIQYIPCSSGFDSVRQDFGKDKINWVNEFKKLNANDIQTKKIFMICDRDNLPIGDIRADGVTANLANATIQIGNNGTAYLLSWKRRQIENYLLSYTALSANNKLAEVLNLLPPNTLIENNNSDNDSVRNVEVKDNLKPLYLDVNPELGIDYNKLEELIVQIPSAEISEDIENMYNFILSKLN